MDYKNTLNLPRTDFAMKADLTVREPQRLQKWQSERLYQKIQAARAGAPKFVLHDGPPFANGDVHIGTALNKILKDIIVKYKTLRGHDAPYIPGWDCHGLPIEFKVWQTLRAEEAANLKIDGKFKKKFEDVPFTKTPLEIRQRCEEEARHWIYGFVDGSGSSQMAQFKRLGVLGDWDNPYLTLDPKYEADELRLFADIVEKEFVYRGKKPVYWSIPARTALAEAEVEYHDHVSQSVFVKFRVSDLPEFVQGSEFIEKVSLSNVFVLIWTTTPWTLPANLAVAFNPKLQYSLIQVGGEQYLILSSLVSSVAEKCKWEKYETLTTVLGSDLEGLEYQHPFCNRKGEAFPADFVTSDTGTGFVHIAPGHGLDDYNLGLKACLPIYSPVDDDGRLCLTDDYFERENERMPIGQQMPENLVGKSLLEKHGKSDANEAVLHELRVGHALLHQENYHHSYPHCWRSKTPIVFRAMDQWFIKIDHPCGELPFEEPKNQGGYWSQDEKKSLRQLALNEIDHVTWIPDWGMNRIKGAVQSRPDWCISRQRTWGVPIPAFYDAQGNAMLDAQVVRNVADLVEKHGSNIWFEKSAGELWSLVRPKDWKGPEATAKSNDTLDVWIDSGSSSRSVLKQRKELQHDKKTGDEIWQADVYLEGSDQHRGWFQSSLLLSLAGNGAVPFKTVLTHGFMVDADREKISKSKQGAYEKPQTAEAYVKKYGADVVRLWVASQDYRNDIVVSDERVNKVGETYRGIRNALRYQLSNLYDFDPAKHTVADDKLTGLDRWILAEFSKLENEVTEAYDKYEFHTVYQKVSQFIAVELSSIYHDAIKDRLYTDPANSHRRRSTQTALHRLVTGLSQMLAPILVFTADEAWEFVPGKNVESVHEAKFKLGSFSISETEQSNWKKLFDLRAQILPELETARQNKLIGKALEAKAVLTVPNEFAAALDAREDLRELLNVSELAVEISTLPVERQKTFCVVMRADGQKCERCWHWETDVGSNPEHPTICDRCVEAVKQSLNSSASQGKINP